MLLAYHNDPKLKVKLLKRLERHRELDQLVKGTYWVKGDKKGCAIGCATHKAGMENPHKAMEKQWGYDLSISYLVDRIFEGLPHADSQMWPTQVAQAIQTGADLSLVTSHFLVWLLSDPKDGVIRFAGGREDVKKCILDVVDLYNRRLSGSEPTQAEWAAAEGAARAAEGAAEGAARAAEGAEGATSAAAWAAEEAARAAARAARAAAWAAEGARAAARATSAAARARAAEGAARATSAAAAGARAAAEGAARAAEGAAWAAEEAARATSAAAYQIMAAKLLTLLQNAPIPGEESK